MLGIIIAKAQGPQGAKTAQAQRDNGGLAAAGKHDLGIAHLDGPPGFADGMGRGGAGGACGKIGPAQTEVHGEEAGAHVGNEHGNHERRKPARPLGQKNLCCSDIVCNPPMPEPMKAPTSSRLTFFMSRSESIRA